MQLVSGGASPSLAVACRSSCGPLLTTVMVNVTVKLMSAVVGEIDTLYWLAMLPPSPPHLGLFANAPVSLSQPSVSCGGESGKLATVTLGAGVVSCQSVRPVRSIQVHEPRISAGKGIRTSAGSVSNGPILKFTAISDKAPSTGPGCNARILEGRKPEISGTRPRGSMMMVKRRGVPSAASGISASGTT